ncbi:ileS, partial [Symbiodinium sp. KB8]
MEKAIRGTMRLPQTAFPMRADAAVREPRLVQRLTSAMYREHQRRRRGRGPVWALHDGPPYANGSLHMGHLLNKVLKDVFNRHRMLRGHSVRYVPGWDCHGLPIELKALESLQEAAKKKSRKSRQGVDTGKLKAAAGLARTMEPLAVRELAREWALRAVQEQMQDFKRWGVMADWEGGDDAAGVYTTLSPAYEAAQLEVLAQLVEGGHVFQGEKPVHWSPAAQSALAEAELEYVDDYTSMALHVRFPLHLASCSGQVQDLAAAATAAAGQGCPPIAAAAWTTTPWTIPASRALAVNPAAAYTAVVVEMPGGQRYPLLAAAELAERVASDIGGELVWSSAQHVEGSQLVGAQVQHPLAA